MTDKLTLTQIDSLLTDNDSASGPVMAKNWRNEDVDIREELSWDWWKYEGDEDPIYIPGLGNASRIAEYGGEGKGDEYWVVVKVTGMEDGTGDRYFRMDGYYASYSGGTFDGEMTEVTPKERLVTFYE